MPQNAPADFSTAIEVRFADLDAYGHVNNAVFFTYLETARTKLFRERLKELLHGGLFFLVAKAECEYRNPVKLEDQVEVSVRAGRVGNSSFDLDYTVHNGHGLTYAEAKTVMVCFDRRLGRPVRLPQDLRQTLGGASS